MATASDIARWHEEISPFGDLAAAVAAGRPLKDAAREARARVYEVEIAARNALLEAEYEEGWRRAPLMTCPEGHQQTCADCAREFRFDDQLKEER
jgi:hypothetical protein